MLTTSISRTSIACIAALLLSPFAHAKQTTWTAVNTNAELMDLQQQVESVGQNYSRRSGLIGSTDAKSRFDDAVVQYLLGNYKSAAETLYVLLETESLHGLEGFDYEREAEWYIADSAYRLGQYALLEEYAYRIIEQPGHLFFTDAVRLLLESYGRRDQSVDFQQIYRRFVITGQVESSNELNYSIGKSFYFQGDTSQAKQALFEVQQGSALWYKAQYFLGGIYVAEKNFEEAIANFKSAINPNAEKQDEVHLNELARIAIARVYFEQRDFLQAITYYEQIPYSSPYFLDRLYETSWALIGLERWNDAIDIIKIFIEAYPENEHASQFKNTLGDLYLQIKKYEQAQKNYTQVIKQLEPVYERLEDLMTQQALVEELLEAKLNGTQDTLDFKLPDNIESKLLNDPTLNKTIEVVSLTSEQRDDVNNAQGYIEEIAAVLANESLPLNSFEKDRSKLNRANEAMLFLLLDSLDHEVSILRSSSKSQVELNALQEEIALLRSSMESEQERTRQAKTVLETELDPWLRRIDQVQKDAWVTRSMTTQVLDEVELFLSENNESLQNLPVDERQFILDAITDIQQKMHTNNNLVQTILTSETHELLRSYLGDDQYYERRVNTIQIDATVAYEDAKDLLYDVNHFLNENSDSVSALPEEQLEDLRMQLDELRQQLEQDSIELEDIASNKSKNVLLARLGITAVQNANLTGYLYDLQDIHNRLFPIWSTSTLKNRETVQQEIDGLWLVARKMNAQREEVLSQIDVVEKRQRPIFVEMLNVEEQSLAQFADEVVVLADSADELGYIAALQAFENVSNEINERMYKAEFGSVRVLSIRNTDKEQERAEMQAARNQQIKQLDLRFSVLKSRLMSELSNE